MVWETLSQWFGQAQQGLYEGVVQPVLYYAGMASLMEDAFEATGWLLVGLLQLLVLVLVIAPLQRWRPVEAVTDRRAIRVDMLYTLVHRLGLFRVALFFSTEPLWNDLFGQLHVWGLPTFQLEGLWPGVTDKAWISFILYLLVFDLLDYWIHRGQHSWGWWWKLHALHHSQRQMTMWSDNRNHLLDDVIHDSVFVLVGLAVGIPPGQFVAVVLIMQLVESLSHANVRLHFGWLGDRLLVSPRFHRVHHAIGIGHESHGAGTLGGHNFAVLFPVWDLLFRTAAYDRPIEPTGIRDQLPQEGGRDYGRGFWAQQWLGLRRLAGRR